MDAQKLLLVIRQFMHSKKTNLEEKLPSREKMNALCELATTEADRLLLKMAVCSELSGKEAQRQYGVQNFSAKRRKIEEAFRSASEIKHAKQFQSLHESRKRHICTRLALTICPVIQRMKIMTLKNLKMLNGFHHQMMQQKMNNLSLL